MSIKAARINGIELSVCGVGELPDYAMQKVTHVVSIWDGYMADSTEPKFQVEAIFPKAKQRFAFFNDVFSPFANATPPTREAIADILSFTSKLRSGDYLLVHCMAGVSRSSAMAYATLCLHAGQGLEEQCFSALKKIRPSASPNPLIVEMVDAFLGRNGRMIQAIASAKPYDEG